MADDEKNKRPERKGKSMILRYPEEWEQGAKERAESEGRSLLDVIRAWLFGYSIGEFPSPPRLPGEGKRAKKRKKRGEGE